MFCSSGLISIVDYFFLQGNYIKYKKNEKYIKKSLLLQFFIITITLIINTTDNDRSKNSPIDNLMSSQNPLKRNEEISLKTTKCSQNYYHILMLHVYIFLNTEPVNATSAADITNIYEKKKEELNTMVFRIYFSILLFSFCDTYIILLLPY